VFEKKSKKDFLFSFPFFFFFQGFCEYIFCKPSQDHSRPVGGTHGFKGLIAMIHAKVSEAF